VLAEMRRALVAAEKNIRNAVEHKRRKYKDSQNNCFFRENFILFASFAYMIK